MYLIGYIVKYVSVVVNLYGFLFRIYEYLYLKDGIIFFVNVFI